MRWLPAAPEKERPKPSMSLHISWSASQISARPGLSSKISSIACLYPIAYSSDSPL